MECSKAMNSKWASFLWKYPSVEYFNHVPISHLTVYNIDKNAADKADLKKMKLSNFFLEVIAAKTIENGSRASPDCP